MHHDSFPPIDQQILDAAQASSETEINLYTLCDDIGPRFVATPGNDRAAAFILERFEAYGLDNAATEPFDMSVWRRGSASLEVTTPFEMALPCYDLPYAPPTGRGGIERPLIDVGWGTDEEIEQFAGQLKGNMALVSQPSRHRSAIYHACVDAGAVAFLIANPTPGLLLNTGSVGSGEWGAIPAVSITYEHAHRLLRSMEHSPVTARLETHSHCEDATTANVVGELIGGERPDELIVVGGHFDSHEIGPGAYDNAAGTVVMMEVARLLADQRQHLGRTVRFIGFTAEEVGVIGSERYAAAHEGDVARTRLMVNLDMPGTSTPWVLAMHAYPELEPHVDTLARQLGADVKGRAMDHNHSDFAAFKRRGVPALGLMGSGRNMKHGGFGHMAADTPEKVPTDGLTDAAAFIARLVLRAASDADWPFVKQ